MDDVNVNVKYILIDTEYLCHRAKYRADSLKFGLGRNAIPLDIIETYHFIKRMIPAEKYVWAFDSKTSKRKEIYPQYKESRKKKKEELEETDFYEQVGNLKDVVLPDMGFTSVISLEGFEGDDVIAKACLEKGPKDKAVIISADQDLYQCLSDSVSMWSPRNKKFFTREIFEEQYGIPTREWSRVKAIAGCSSDSVKGIEGVGEKRALEYITGKMKESSRYMERINSGRDVIDRNMSIVEVPMRGTPSVLESIRKSDEVSAEKLIKTKRSLAGKSKHKKGYLF